MYAEVQGWESFEPWLSRVEEMPARTLWEAAEGIPPEWYGGDFGVLEGLMKELQRRQGRLRELIEDFRRSDRRPFPMWEERERNPGTRRMEAAPSFIM